MAESVTIQNIVALGSIAISPDSHHAAIAPRLPFSTPADILVDGQPDYLAALHWRYRLTPTLRGRDRELADILAWAEAGGDTVTARLITGPGGGGKTRLAAEAAQHLRARGWTAGFLPREADSGAVIASDKRPILLVIDYPEERRALVDALFRRASDLTDIPMPIRLLLLSRKPFEEWDEYRSLLGPRFGQQALANLDQLPPSDLLPILTEAAEGFARLLDRPTPDLAGADAWLAASEQHRLPLIATAAGIHAALTGRTDFALGGSALIDDLARRELARVRGIGRAQKLGDHGLARLLGLSLFSHDGLSANDLQALGRLEATPLRGQALIDAVAGTPWWQPRTIGSGRRLARLEPDRPAASFLARVLLDDPAPALPNWVFAIAEASAGDFPDRLSRLCFDLATDKPAHSRILEGQALRMIQTTPERIALFRSSAFRQATAFSAAFSAEVAATLLRIGDLPDDQRAGLFNNRSVYLSALNRREEALAAAKEAADLTRALADARPDAFRPNLAMALNNLANRFSALGRREEALAAAQEAADLYRALADARPDAFRPDLAMALNNLANHLSDLGRREDALAAAQEAADLYHALADARPDAFRPDLAMALNTLANRLSDLGRREDALAAAQEAVDLRRTLADARPDAFRPDLASALNNLANRLSELGRREDALAAAQEAADLYRALADARPDAFRPDLASALNTLANCLSDLGRREEALATAQEAADLTRALADARPDAFRPNLAIALNNLANRLSGLGRREEALTAAQEASDLYRTLADARPDAFRPDLAMALNNLANHLSELGRREDALAAALEAVDLRRALADARPDAFRPDLAGALNTLANRLFEFGRREDALAAAKEAADLYRALADARPDAFRPDLAGALANLANRLSDLGRREDALAAAQEAADLTRALADARPDVFRHYLAGALTNLALRLSDLGRREDALAAAREAVATLGPYFLARPAAFAHWMLTMVRNYRFACQESGTEPDPGLLDPIVAALQPFLPPTDLE